MDRWIALGDQTQSFAEPVAPGQHAFGVELADLGIEQLVLIGEGRCEAPGVCLRQVGQHLGEKLQPNQKSLQRIFVEFITAAEDVLEHSAILGEVAQQQPLGELTLVLEMVEEAAFRNTGRRNQLVDRGGGKPLGEHRALGKFEQSLPGIAALAWNIVEHRQTVPWVQFPPAARANTPRPRAISFENHAKNNVRTGPSVGLRVRGTRCRCPRSKAKPGTSAMPKYRNQLPQLSGRLFLTDGGLETTLIFHDGIDLPYFASFDLLRTKLGPAHIRAY